LTNKEGHPFDFTHVDDLLSVDNLAINNKQIIINDNGIVI